MYKVTIKHDEGAAIRVLSYLFQAEGINHAYAKGKREANRRGFIGSQTSISTELLQVESVVD